MSSRVDSLHFFALLLGRLLFLDFFLLRRFGWLLVLDELLLLGDVPDFRQLDFKEKEDGVCWLGLSQVK